MSSGAVGSVRRVRNPVEAARAVMERSEHALLVGDEASAWAEAQGLQMEDEVSAIYLWRPHRGGAGGKEYQCQWEGDMQCKYDVVFRGPQEESKGLSWKKPLRIFAFVTWEIGILCLKSVIIMYTYTSKGILNMLGLS